MTTKSFFILAALAALLNPILGQHSANIRAWIDIQTTDGKTVISSWCQNDNSSPVKLSYKATLFSKDTVVQTGKMLAIPGQPNLLLNGSFLVQDGQFERVLVHVFKDDELAATAQSNGPPKLELPIADSGPALKPSDDSHLPGRAADEIEIEGLVLDDTRSKLAHDFYEQFYNSWSGVEERIATAHNIVIRETPNVTGIGTRIIVEVDGQELTTLNLQPRGDVVESLASQLVEALQEQFTNPENTVREIATDDLSGTGVY